MLKLAYTYRDKLNQAWQSVVFNEKYKYYNNGTCWSYEIELDDNSWDSIEMVSVDRNDNVIGFFRACCYRTSNIVSNISMINFYDINITFSKDMYKFIDDLFVLHNFNKIEWLVLVGNPAEHIYDKFINKYDGNIIGVKHKTSLLTDGKYYDNKEYELLKENYLKHRKLK